METREFTHPQLNREIEAISGHYEYIEESTIEYGERKLLLLSGYSVTDRSCCGTGGCIFISIPGYIVDHHHAQKEDGSFISTVEPVVDEEQRSSIRRLIRSNGYCQEVIFME